MSIHRKVLAGACSAVLALALIGCGSSGSSDEGADSSASVEETTTEAPEVTTAPDSSAGTDDSSPPTTNDAVADTVAPSGEGSTLEMVILDDESASSDAIQLAVGGEVAWRNAGSADRTCTTEGGTPGPIAIAVGSEQLVTYDTAGTYVVTCDLDAPVTVTVTVG